MSWFKAQASGDGKASVVIDRAIGSDWAPDWVSDFTGEKPARDFIDAIEALGELSEINIDLNSPGGDVASGIRIMNYLKNHPATVNIRVTGMAASIATVILMAGDKRTMGVGATIMVHNPMGWMAGYFTESEMRERAEAMSVIKTAMVEAYMEGTGSTAEAISELLDKGDTYLGADDAIAMGFITHKDAKLKAVASADPEMFKAQLETQGTIRALTSARDGLQAQLDALKNDHDQVVSALQNELDAFKNPVAASADEVIEICSQHGLDALAVQMVKQKLPASTVQARIQMAKDVQDIAKASGIEASPLMAHLDSPIQMISAAITEAKALVDQNIDHHHVPGTGLTAKQPDSKKAYAQLNHIGV